MTALERVRLVLAGWDESTDGAETVLSRDGWSVAVLGSRVRVTGPSGESSTWWATEGKDLRSWLSGGAGADGVPSGLMAVTS